MSAENNIRLAHYLTLQLNQRNIAIVDALFSPQFVSHDVPPGQPNGIAAYKQALALVWTAFPDYASIIEDAVADGTKVATIGHFEGTHNGPFFNLPPTGRRVWVRSASIVEIQGGQVVAQWGILDLMSLFRQLQTGQ